MPKHGVQLISQDMKFNNELNTYMKEEGMSEQGQAFHVVSIIGGQSSGKSTLLNAMFGTSFDMMDPSKGRQQTTCGIWCCKADGSKNILVMDVEGTDGREKEDQKTFEGKSALFCLALTDVLIINLWLHEVGRFNAANLPLLKTIFEVHLKLLMSVEAAKKDKVNNAPRSRPLLLFIVRDCDGRTPVENLKQIILADLNKIWADMNKPEKYAASSMDDFFEDFVEDADTNDVGKIMIGIAWSVQVQCEGLPHYVYKADEWQGAVNGISAQFTNGGVFKNRNDKDVPAESFAEYAEQLWTTIESDGDLDLPNQRKMLSIVRCDNKRKVYLERAQREHEQDAEWVPEDRSSFRASLEGKQQQYAEEFQHETVGYDEEVREETKQKLQADMLPLVQEKYERLVAEAQKRAEGGLAEVVSSLRPQDGELPVAGYSARLREEAERIMREFRAELEEVTPKGAAAWREKLFEKDGTVEVVQERLEREQQAAKKELEVQVKLACERKLNRELARLLVPLLDEAPLNMWAEVRRVHQQQIQRATDSLRDILEDLGLWTATSEKVVGESLRMCADAAVNDKVTDKASERSLSAKILQRFDQLFNRGRGRAWRLWDNPDAEYTKARAVGLAVLDMFSVSQLYEEGHWPKGTAAVRYIDADRREVLEAEFEARAREELVWAQMARQNSSMHSSVLFACLALVLGWNEIWWLLTHPLQFTVILVAGGGGGVYYFLHFVGDWQQLVALVLKTVMRLLSPAAAAPPAGYGATPDGPGEKDPLAHAAHLAGPPGRQRRPQTAPPAPTEHPLLSRSSTAPSSTLQ